MIPTKELPKHFNQLLISLWRLVEPYIDDNHKKAFKEEDVNGETSLFQKSQDRLLIVYLGVLMELRQYDNDVSQAIVERFGGEKLLREIFSCRRLSYNKFMEILSFEDTSTDNGISATSISDQFKIGEPYFEKFFSKIEVERLLNLEECCTITLGNLEYGLGYQTNDDGISTEAGMLIKV